VQNYHHIPIPREHDGGLTAAVVPTTTAGSRRDGPALYYFMQWTTYMPFLCDFDFPIKIFQKDMQRTSSSPASAIQAK